MKPRAFEQREGATAAVGHMPFPGHRTVAAIWKKRDVCRWRASMREREAKGFGFDPESLKASGR